MELEAEKKRLIDRAKKASLAVKIIVVGFVLLVLVILVVRLVG